MAASDDPRPDAHRRQGVLKKRFEGMGLSPEELPGGSALVVTLPLASEPFQTPSGRRVIRSAREMIRRKASVMRVAGRSTPKSRANLR